MAYLSEKSYQAKGWYTYKRALDNRAVLANDKLADKLDDICTMRHELHANMVQKAERLYNMESAEHETLWEYVSGLSSITGYRLPCTLEDMPLSEDPYQGITNTSPDLYKVEAIEFYIDLIEKINTATELWLQDFDLVHGTNYAPTGLSRKF